MKNKKWKAMQFFEKALIVYATTSLIGILIIRNGSGGIGFQAHAYFLMSILSCASLITYLLKKRLSTYTIVVVTGVFTIFSLPNKYLGVLIPERSYEPKRYLVHKNAELQNSNQNFYKMKKNEPYWMSELNSSMSGLRIRAKDVKYMDYGQIRRWVIGGKEKCLDCPMDKCKTNNHLTEEEQKKCNHCATSIY